MAFKHKLIGAGFAAMRASGLHKAMGRVVRGVGIILTLHHVRPWRPVTPGFAPNRLLEITPEFFDELLTRVRAAGFEFVTLDEAAQRLETRDGRPFAAMTFDDGYRDTRDFALPVLERHGAPATVFLATGFLERTAQLWWLELEEAIRRLEKVEFSFPPMEQGVPTSSRRTGPVRSRVDGRDKPGRDVSGLGHGGVRLRLDTRDVKEKSAAFDRIYWMLRARPEAELLTIVQALADEAGVSSRDLAEALFMNPIEAVAFAAHPLIAIGAHSHTHRRLAKWPREQALEEMVGSKAGLETLMSREVTSFAYPVGDPTSAGSREFKLAREAGFRIAVTTRPGMLFPEHADHLTALPRVSLNGMWQDGGYLDVLLTGAPFALWNRGRRLNVA